MMYDKVYAILPPTIDEGLYFTEKEFFSVRIFKTLTFYNDFLRVTFNHFSPEGKRGVTAFYKDDEIKLIGRSKMDPNDDDTFLIYINYHDKILSLKYKKASPGYYEITEVLRMTFDGYYMRNDIG